MKLWPKISYALDKYSRRSTKSDDCHSMHIKESISLSHVALSTAQEVFRPKAASTGLLSDSWHQLDNHLLLTSTQERFIGLESSWRMRSRLRSSDIFCRISYPKAVKTASSCLSFIVFGSLYRQFDFAECRPPNVCRGRRRQSEVW